MVGLKPNQRYPQKSLCNRLGRTMVGLKLLRQGNSFFPYSSLGRTMVGLKPLRKPNFITHANCLGRTMVGLKPTY